MGTADQLHLLLHQELLQSLSCSIPTPLLAQIENFRAKAPATGKRRSTKVESDGEKTE